LIDARTGEHVWANRYDQVVDNVVALQQDVASKIYASIGGFEGELQKSAVAAAWQKSAPSLEEYDYYLRGHAVFFRFTKEDNIRAREIWAEGLARFTDSALLRVKICFTYEVALVNEWSEDPSGDVQRAWRLATEARAIENKSSLATWLGHIVMSFLFQWHDGDFARSVVEAKAAADMVPNDARTIADMAGFLTNAGEVDEAIKWLERAIRLDPKGPDWYHYNLSWAYYHAGRYEEALAAYKESKAGVTTNLAAVYIRLGRMDEARATIAELLKVAPGYSLRAEAKWPGGRMPQMVEPLLQPFLEDVRRAGLPE
jgi:adenylate cyclase